MEKNYFKGLKIIVKKLIVNYLFNASFQLLLVLVPFITTPYIARVLGPENLGVYAYSFSIIQILLIISMLGIPIYGNKQIATVTITKDKSKISNEFWSIYLLQVIMTSLCIIFYICYSIFLPSFMQKVILLQGIHLFAFMLDISWFLLGLQRIKQTVLRNFLVKIISVILIFIFVKDKSDLGTYIFILSCSALVGQLFLWTYVRKYINFKFKFKSLDLKKHLKPILILFLPQILGQFYLSFDKILLNYFTDEVQVGYYDQALKIIKMVTTLITSLGVVVLPSIATEFVKGNNEKISYYVNTILRYILFITIPMVIGLICISGDFVQWFLGNDFYKVGDLLKIISPSILFIGLGSLFGVQILAATNQNGKLTVSILCGALTSILISILFVPHFGMYATGVATVLTEIVVTSVQLYFVKDYIEFKKVWKSVVIYVFSGLIMALVINIFNQYSIPLILKTFIQILIGGVTYLSLLFLLKDSFILQVVRQLYILIKSKLLKRGI